MFGFYYQCIFHLFFSVPPDIIDEETSSDVTVREGENATLVCRAKGHPVPRIIWKREDGGHLQFKSGPRDIVRGKSFVLSQIMSPLLNNVKS